jgi:hypothetical protein
MVRAFFVFTDFLKTEIFVSVPTVSEMPCSDFARLYILSVAGSKVSKGNI